MHLFTYSIILESLVRKNKLTFHTHAKVVGIMRQNACTLAFCVHQLLQFTPNVRKLLQNLALV